MTPHMLWMIKVGLRNSNMDLSKKRLMWLYCCWAYVGAFRFCGSSILPQFLLSSSSQVC